MVHGAVSQGRGRASTETHGVGVLAIAPDKDAAHPLSTNSYII